MEKIKGVEGVLDLAKKEPPTEKQASDGRPWFNQKINAGRTINLRRDKTEAASFIEKAIEGKKGRKKLSRETGKRQRSVRRVFVPDSLSWPELPIWQIKQFKGERFIITESLMPDRKELLSQLEEVERRDNFLKTADFKKSFEPEELITEPEPIENLIFIEPADFVSIDELILEPDLRPAELAETVNLSDEEDLFFEEELSENSSSEAHFFPEKEEGAPEWFKAGQPLAKEPVFDIVRFRNNFLNSALSAKNKWWKFAGVGLSIFLIISGLSIVGRGLAAKSSILGSALEAYRAMLAAKDSAVRFDFTGAGASFEAAYQDFFQAEQELNKMGQTLIFVLEKMPGGSIVTSGSALVSAGEDLAKAGKSFSKIANLFLLQNISGYFSAGGESLTQKIVAAQSEIETARLALLSANDNLAKVDAVDLPASMTESVLALKEKVPVISQAVTQLDGWANVFLAILGHQKASKYLLIFQNNAEARPTGGFIGTYGLLNMDEGRIKELFIDGIFNLDGQLNDKIIPPKPIQKISTAWSTHDANWFADFPTSAKKIASFYEKAGGETIDGVISLTPTLIENLLAVTGPIAMSEYGVELNQANFMDVTQYKVEVDYDKKLNQPKKILADFAPKFLDRLWQVWPDKYQEIFKILVDNLAEKHILFYFTNSDLEEIFKKQSWAGEVLSTDKDYLSVINTNINGYKTDRVIEQKIEHQAEVQTDGSVIDTIKIIRRHLGGQSQYDWYNQVNADYLRVYVPLGSRLLSARGQTLEAYSEPIDYQQQNFKTDSDVLAQEQSIVVDQNSGTQIFTESGKTVFANWVYVSPGESVELEYKYLLPFKLSLSAENFSYSLMAQKQSGSVNSDLASFLRLPKNYKIDWRFPESLIINGSEIKFNNDLARDRFYGIVFNSHEANN